MLPWIAAFAAMTKAWVRGNDEAARVDADAPRRSAKTRKPDPLGAGLSIPLHHYDFYLISRIVRSNARSGVSNRTT